MSETSLYGYIVHVDSAVRKECSEGIFVIKYVIYGSVNHLTIFVTCSTHSQLNIVYNKLIFNQLYTTINYP